MAHVQCREDEQLQQQLLGLPGHPAPRSEELHSSAGIRQENEPESLEKPFYLNITSVGRNTI